MGASYIPPVGEVRNETNFSLEYTKAKKTLENPKRRWENNIKTDVREITRLG